MELFDRFWELRIKDREGAFDFTIEQDEFGNSLRSQFEINATIDLRYYTGTIKIYNLEPSKRKQLVFNQLQEEFGTGPLVQLKAGYKQANGIIFNGAVTRGYTIRQPESGDWVTTLYVGLPFNQAKQVTIDSQVINNSNLLSFLKTTIDTVINQPDRIPIDKAPDYNANFKAAIDDYLAAGNVANDSQGYNGTSIQIIKEIENKYNLIFFQDHTGFNVTGGKYTTSSNQRDPIVLPAGTIVPEITISSETGLIGSPIYTDTGAKIISLLRPELKMFQFIRVESDILNRNISIVELIHRGDTFTNEWFSEIDGSNFNQLIRA